MNELLKDFEKTDYKCPECGEPVFKHFHRRDHPSTQTYENYWYYCFNLCWLDCRNCRYSNTHGECDLEFCMAHSGWKPKVRCAKCTRKVDNLVVIGINVYGDEIKQLWCNDCIEKQKKEEKDGSIRIISGNHLKQSDNIRMEVKEIECVKCGRKADNWVIIKHDIFGNEIKEPWCNNCIKKRKKEEKEKGIGRNHLKRPDE